MSDYFRTKLATSFDDRKLLIDLKAEIDSEKRLLKRKIQAYIIHKGQGEHDKRQKFIKKNKDLDAQITAIRHEVDARLIELKHKPLERSTDTNKHLLTREPAGDEFRLLVKATGKAIAILYKEADGMYVVDFISLHGWSAWILKAIAAHVDELNWTSFSDQMMDKNDRE